MFDIGFAENLLERIGGNAAIIVLDENGICVFANKNTETVLQVPQASLVNCNFLETIDLYTLEGARIELEKNIISRALHDAQYAQSTPFFCKLKPEDEQTLALNTFRIADATEMQYLVVQIRTAQREVQVGEMKSLFVSFAAHQLKTPSSVVKGFLELMMRNGENAYSKEQWHFLKSAFESNEQLIAVSKSLLNMARLEGGLIEPQIHEFNPFLSLENKIASFVSVYKIKNLTVQLEPTSDTHTMLRSDQSFFLEVFGILLGNAIKHSPEGKIISVSCQMINNTYEVHVKDEGAGIAPGLKATLFKTEQDSSEKENSHGLGLYMAKKYIALLGGTIGIADSEHGSDFYFCVPNVTV